MKYLSRVFSYVWPQWPRVVVCILSAFLLAVLFSLSFATVIPLLKVMMGEEGMHGWIDRKVCNWQYGMNFNVPDITDVSSDQGEGILYYLLVTGVKKDSLAHQAGLKDRDRIVGAGDLLLEDDTQRIQSRKLIERLATADDMPSIKVQYRRINNEGLLELHTADLTVPGKETAADKIRWKAVTTVQWAVGFLPREETKANKSRAVIFIILLMAVVTTLRCFARFYQSYLADKIVHVAIARMRQDAFSHVIQMPVGFFSSKGTSDTTSRLIGDIASAGGGAKLILGKTLREPLKAISTLILAMLISWQLTLIFLAAAPITIFCFGLLGKKIKKAARKLLKSNAAMLGRIQGAMAALRVVKVYNRQEHEIALYKEVNTTLLRRMLHVSKIDAMANPLMEWLGMVAGSAALIVGVSWVSNSTMEASSFFGLLLFLGTSAESVRKVSDVWNLAQQANAAAERVFAVIDESVEHEMPGAIELKPLKNAIEFRNIVFTYPGAAEPTLKNVNLTVKAGKTIAIVGPNGSGKTTLINLLPRFYDPDSGSILIDGQDIHQGTLKSLRSQISMVTQQVVTFNDTVAANIAYGKQDATMDEIIAAAKSSFCHEFIVPLEKGYDTVIGEHSSGFSGGQLQRIVIARAIIKNPAILIFDEAMSQVDADSEAKIHDALSELMHKRTCFVIAHRFSTVISADTIVVVDGGRIVGQGTHDQLLQTSSLYRSLYETQLIVPQ